MLSLNKEHDSYLVYHTMLDSNLQTKLCFQFLNLYLYLLNVSFLFWE